MAKGRSSAVVGAVMVCLLVLQYSQMARAAVHTVGGDQGWTIHVASWSKPKHFGAGDMLVFNYNPAADDVMAVNRKAYKHCTTSSAVAHSSARKE